MTPEEAQRIASEIEADNELSTEYVEYAEEPEETVDDEDLEELEGLVDQDNANIQGYDEVFETEPDDDEDYGSIADLFEEEEEVGTVDMYNEEDEDQPKEIIKEVKVVEQPVITFVEVGATVGEKGELKPFAKGSVTRHIAMSGEETEEIFNIIAADFEALVAEVFNALNQ